MESTEWNECCVEIEPLKRPQDQILPGNGRVHSPVWQRMLVPKLVIAEVSWRHLHQNAPDCPQYQLAGPCSQRHPVREPAAPYRPDRLEETRYCWPLLPAQGASCQPARVMGANPRQAEAGETCYHFLKHPTGWYWWDHLSRAPRMHERPQGLEPKTWSSAEAAMMMMMMIEPRHNQNKTTLIILRLIIWSVSVMWTRPMFSSIYVWNEYVTIAVNRNLSNCQKARKKGFRGFNGIRTRGLCVSAAVLYQSELWRPIHWRLANLLSSIEFNCDSLRWSHTHFICIPAVHIISFCVLYT